MSGRNGLLWYQSGRSGKVTSYDEQPEDRGRLGGRARGPVGRALGPTPEHPETEAERRKRQAVFLRELAEARELRERVQPRRTKERRMREAMRMRTFRI